jgi:DnaJ-domain-containing protein 1
MRQTIQELKARVEDSWIFATDRLFQESMDSYFVFEERLEEIEQVLAQIEAEMEQAGEDEGFLRALGRRLEFLEDHFDEIDSGARNRPARRRRRRFSLSDFFRWAGEPGIPSPAEVTTSAQAYEALDLPIGTGMRTVKAAFRRLIKELHPDARGGDRSTEPRLRKIVAAYEYIKKNGAAEP